MEKQLCDYTKLDKFPDAYLLEPKKLNAYESFCKNRLQVSVTEVYGKSLPDITPNLIILPVIDAGWGHRILNIGLGQYVVNIFGCKALYFNPMDVLNEKDGYMIRSKLRLHHQIVQLNGNLDDLSKDIFNEAPGILMKLKAIFGNTLMKIAMTASAVQNDQNIFSKIVNYISRLGERFIIIPRQLIKFMSSVDIILSEKPMLRVLDKIIKSLEADNILTTHSYTVRGGVNVPAISCIPDPGYGPIEGYTRDGYVSNASYLQPFTPTNFRSHNAFYTVPNKKMKDIMQNVYGAKKDKVFVLHTPSNALSKEEMIEKWRDGAQYNILFSTNGHATNIEEINIAIQDFMEIPNKERGKFKLLIFTGEHSDTKLGKSHVELRQSVMKLGLSNIEFIQTKSKGETGIKKWEALKLAHFEIRPAGENAMIDSNMGCIPIFTRSYAENEIRNTIWATRRGLGILSSYPAEHFEYWKEKSLKYIDKVSFFEKPFTDLSDYLEYMCKNKLLIRDFAFHAYNNNTPTGSYMTSLLMIGQLLNVRFSRKILHKIERETKLVANEWRKKNFLL